MNSSLEYFSFKEPALNTFDATLAQKYIQGGAELLEKITRPIKSLKNILDENLPANTDIDFLSIDVEGLDLEVLKSNDWDKYRPGMVLVECFNNGLEGVFESEVYKFLRAKKYNLYAKTMNTFIFKESA